MRITRSRRRWPVRLAIGVLCLAAVAFLAYKGLLQYLDWKESGSPSTSQVLILRDGTQIPLVQPTSIPGIAVDNLPGTIPLQLTPDAVIGTSNTSGGAAAPLEGFGQSLTEAYLPPIRIAIPAIGVDRPVVLSTNDNLPRFKGIGWFLGSAFPGRAGNLVLLGHLDGPYATFGRLRELAQGAIFSVFTEAGEYQYRVERGFDVAADDVAVLAPATDATATLITCSGVWNKATQEYSQRYVVVAAYIGKIPLASETATVSK
jgi:LPXTG-site transpeptidase (sortase) family protein